MQNNQNTPLLLSVVYGIIRSTKAGDRPSPETKGNEDESQGNQGQGGAGEAPRGHQGRPRQKRSAGANPHQQACRRKGHGGLGLRKA